MNCAWQSLLNVLPVWIRNEVDKYKNSILQELRLRINHPPELIMHDCTKLLSRNICADDLVHCVNTASKYSPWTSNSIKNGYITAPGGHRIGIFGAASDYSTSKGIHHVTSLCIRIARDFQEIANSIEYLNSSILIIGIPGCGKTTLLRDLIRRRSNVSCGSISVIDEKCEIFPITSGEFCFPVGKHTDVLSGCGKSLGIEMAIRNMGPEIIAVDEITAEDDCSAIIHAGWCGVKLYATAHASSKEDLFQRKIYRPIIESNLFDMLITMYPNKSFTVERL